MADIDEDLAAALKQCKGKKMHFAFIPKGSDGKLIVSKRKIAEKEVAAAKKEIGGGNPVRGKCFGPLASMMFQVAKEQSPTLTAAIKKVAKRDTGLTVIPNVQVATDAEAEEAETGETETETTDQATQAADLPPDDGAKAEVTKRLAALTESFKQAVAQNGPDVAQMQALMTSFKDMLTIKDYAGAAKILDQLEPLVAKAAQQKAQEHQKLLAKKAETEKKIAEVEKLPHAANVAPEIAISKQKVVNAMKLVEPPGQDYAGAMSALVGVDAVCVTLKKMTEDYQKVLTIKTDTDKKIARLEKHPKKALITAEIADVKAKETAALALADPPKQDYVGAIKSLNAVDKKCAAAEVKILDETVRGMDRGDMHDFMEKSFKERFGIELNMKDKGETPTEAYAAVRRVYELMALVPESHTNRNPSLKKVTRIGGASKEASYYESTTDIFLGLGTKGSKKVVLQGMRPTNSGTELQNGLTNSAGVVDPPVEEDCKPRPDVSTTQSYFDWTTLHEIAHGIDDKQGFMKKNADLAGWMDHGTSCSAAAQAVANHFNFKTKEALEYIRDLLEGKPGNRPSDKPTAPSGRADWNTVRGNVEKYCDSIRVNEKPWDNLAASIGDRVHHESYPKFWVSYLRAKRSQAITGYQFRAPGEWFSELYAAYNSGVLKDSHPMVKRFLQDL